MDNLQKNVLLKNYTTYKIGGPAKYFFIAKSKEDLLEAIKSARKLRLPVFILGGGSNILFSDKGFGGVVIKTNFSDINIVDDKIYIGAGFSLTKLAYLSADRGLSGLEWAAGVPGATIGGAIYGHAQAFGVKISNVLESVETLNCKTLKFRSFSKEQCQFSLKNSVFKKKKNLIIISAVLKFDKKQPEEIRSIIKKYLHYRKTRHPMNFPSAGSTFVNPEIIVKNKKLLEKYPELVEFNKKGTIASGYLIEKCGLSGKKIGQAQISEKHANFIVNLGGAKAKDVLTLIKLAHQKVKKTFNINLETEVQIIKYR